METQDMSYGQIKRLAESRGLNTRGKGREALVMELAEVGVTSEAPKGRRSWAPARMLDLNGKMPGFRYRWVDVDPSNIRKKLAEGWQFVNKETGHPVEHQDPGLMHGGTAPDTSVRYRDVVAMALPEETGQARDEYFREINERQIAGVNRAASDKMRQVGPDASVHGDLKITRIT